MGHRASQRMNRGRQPERLIAMAAWPLEADLVAAAAGCKVSDRLAFIAAQRRLQADEGLDLLMLRKDVLDAFQVTQAFFPHIAAKNDVAIRLDLRGLHRLGDGQHGGQRARIVCNAGRVQPAILFGQGQVRRHRIHRVEVGGQHDRGAVAAAFVGAHHVAGLVDMHLIQAQGLEAVGYVAGALALFKGWRGNGVDGLGIGQGFRFILFNEIQRLPDWGLLKQLAHRRGDAGLKRGKAFCGKSERRGGGGEGKGDKSQAGMECHVYRLIVSDRFSGARAHAGFAMRGGACVRHGRLCSPLIVKARACNHGPMLRQWRRGLNFCSKAVRPHL